MTEPYQIVNQSFGPPPRAWTHVYAYDGSGALEYQGWAESTQPEKEWRVAAAELTSITDAANTSTILFAADHGLEVGHEIKISGSSVAALNGTYTVATVPGATSVTVTTSGVADAVYNNVGLKVSTLAPRKNASCWVIQKNIYTAGALTSQKWAKGQSQTANLVWDNRATYDYR